MEKMYYVHEEANIHPSVVIGPFACIEKNVEIGEGTVIGSNVTICEGTRIGKNCRIFPGAVVGAIPQDLKFNGEDTLAIIGDNTTIREFVTIHRGTASKGKTVVGNNCLIMAYCHVAHDCVVKDHVIMSNATQLAGEVVVEDHAIIGGGTLKVGKDLDLQTSANGGNASTLRFAFGPDGIGKLAVDGDLKIADNAKLVVDMSGYTGRARSFRFMEVGGATVGSFASVQFVPPSIPGGEDLKLVEGDGVYRVKNDRGLCILVR